MWSMTFADSGDANSNYGNYSASGSVRPVSMHAAGSNVLDNNRNDATTSSQGDDMWRNTSEMRIGKTC